MINSCTKWITARWLLTKKILLPIVVMMLIVALKTIYFINSFENASGGDVIISTFTGYGLGYFNFISFVFLLLFNNIPLYYFCSLLSDNCIKNIHVVIRINNPKKLFSSLQTSFISFVIIYVVLSVIETILIACLYSFESINTIFILKEELNFLDSIWVTLVTSIMLRILELLFIELLFFFLYVNIKKITMSFYISIALYSLLIFKVADCFPYGISSLLRQNSYEGMYISLLWLLTLCGLLYLYFKFIGYKRINHTMIN